MQINIDRNLLLGWRENAHFSFRVNIGQTVKLPCSAKDSSEFVRMWKHGDRLLYTDRVSVSSDPRFALDESDAVSLLVRDIVPEDAGMYTCAIMVRSGEALEITHEVEVLETVFSVRPVPSSGQVTVKEGDSTAIECRIAGISPNSSDGDESRFSWRREGLPFTSNGQHTFEGNIYDITNATREDAGHYFCTADANIGKRQQLRYKHGKNQKGNRGVAWVIGIQSLRCMASLYPQFL